MTVFALRMRLGIVGLIVSIITTVGASSEAHAWAPLGHMEVAAIAWGRLDVNVRAKVDALLALNPDYSVWTAGVAPQNRAQLAFVHAATWADDIKGRSTYTNDSGTQSGADANVGYTDMLQHRYWHFIDEPYTQDGSATETPATPNALSEITLMTSALADPVTDDGIKSYDLVWLEHLVGDVHQPLHAVTRYSADFAAPQGDKGGNSEKVVPPGGHSEALHFFWDNLPGSSTVASEAIRAARHLRPADTTLASKTDPQDWIDESLALAETVAYQGIADGASPQSLSASYAAAAKDVADAQVALAGVRLGNLIEDALR